MKMAARLRAATDGVENASPVLLRIDPNAGHGRGDTALQRWALSADQYGFLFKYCAPK